MLGRRSTGSNLSPGIDLGGLERDALLNSMIEEAAGGERSNVKKVQSEKPTTLQIVTSQPSNSSPLKTRSCSPRTTASSPLPLLLLPSSKTQVPIPQKKSSDTPISSPSSISLIRSTPAPVAVVTTVTKGKTNNKEKPKGPVKAKADSKERKSTKDVFPPHSSSSSHSCTTSTTTTSATATTTSTTTTASATAAAATTTNHSQPLPTSTSFTFSKKGESAKKKNVTARPESSKGRKSSKKRKADEESGAQRSIKIKGSGSNSSSSSKKSHVSRTDKVVIPSTTGVEDDSILSNPCVYCGTIFPSNHEASRHMFQSFQCDSLQTKVSDVMFGECSRLYGFLKDREDFLHSQLVQSGLLDIVTEQDWAQEIDRKIGFQFRGFCGTLGSNFTNSLLDSAVYSIFGHFDYSIAASVELLLLAGATVTESVVACAGGNPDGTVNFSDPYFFLFRACKDWSPSERRCMWLGGNVLPPLDDFCSLSSSEQDMLVHKTFKRLLCERWDEDAWQNLLHLGS